MKFVFILSILFVDLIIALPQAEAFTGLKTTYREGQPGWRRQRRNAAKRRRLEARAEKARNDLSNKPVERNGVQRYEFDYWYPTSMHATGLIESAKKAMVRENVNRLIVVITANKEDLFSWFVKKSDNGEFEVTADTLKSAKLAGVRFEPHPNGRQFRDVEEHDGERVTIFEYAYPDPNEFVVRDFLEESRAEMELEKLDRLLAVITDNDGDELYTYLLFRNSEGKILIGADNFKSAEKARVELALTLLSCEGLVK